MAAKIEIKAQQKIDKTNEKILSRFQRRYRIVANSSGRGSRSLFRNHDKTLSLKYHGLRKEKQEIETALKITTGITHTRKREQEYEEVVLHVECQERLQDLINSTRLENEQLNSQIKRTEREIYLAGQRGLTDHAYNENVRANKRSLELLQGRVIVSKHHECEMIAENTKLRTLIDHFLHSRQSFNKNWQFLVQQLVKDNKFLLELTERAVMAFNQGTEICMQSKSLQEEIRLANESHIREMDENIRKMDAANKSNEFYRTKGHVRQLAELEPREVLRRQLFRDEHNAKLKLYKKVLAQVKEFYDVSEIEQVVAAFTKTEYEYFANFKYMNELTYQMELLNASLNQLYTNIDTIHQKSMKRREQEMKTIRELKKKLQLETQLANKKTKELEERQDQVQKILEQVFELFGILQCDEAQWRSLLGNYTSTTQFNICKFLTALEEKLFEVISFVYYIEQKDRDPNSKTKLVIRDLYRNRQDPTDINKIVVVQPCPECAESEDVNRYDKDLVEPLGPEEIRNKVKDKLKSFEVHNRLHSISHCRLPKSRNIVNKRFL